MPRAGRIAGVVLLVTCPLLAALPASAGGEIRGTIHTTDGRTLTGPIRWDRNEVFWDDLLDGTRNQPKPPPDPDDREFRFSIFGLRIGGEDHPHTHHPLRIPFGHLRALEPNSNLEARLILKNGKEIEVAAGSTDLGARLREIRIVDPTAGEVVLGWSDLRRVEFGPEGEGPGRDADRLYGTVTVDGQEVTGYLTFNADYALGSDTASGRGAAESRAVALGEIRSLRNEGGEVLLTLREAAEPLRLRRFEAGRGKVSVAVPGLGLVEAPWDGVERIDFVPAPASPRYGAFDGGRRLAGTVHPRGGTPVSGQLTWDRDEIYSFDALEGDAGPFDYSIPFSNVRSIVRKSSLVSEVRLRDDRVVELSGSNDVNDENRGILVRLPDGSVREFDWADLERVEFQSD